MSSQPDKKYTPKLLENIQRKIDCPICLESYKELSKVPKIICKSQHTICYPCFVSIKGRCKQNQSPTCPFCRSPVLENIITNPELLELCIYFNDSRSIINSLKNQISCLNRIVNKLEHGLQEKQKQVMKLKKDVELLQMNQAIQYIEKREIQKDNKKSEDQKQYLNVNDKMPLKWFLEGSQVTNYQQICLSKKQYSQTQIEYFVKYDLTSIKQLSLGFNRIGNQGLRLLCQQAQMPNIRVLKIGNNYINKLPNLQKICHLEDFQLGNYEYTERLSYNMLDRPCMNRLLEYKWEKLRCLSFQFYKYQIFENEQFVDKMVENWPSIFRIQASQCNSKISKLRCQTITNLMNAKILKTSRKNKMIFVQRSL